MATRAGFEPAVFSVTGRYAEPLHQRAVPNFGWGVRFPHTVKVYQGLFLAVKLKLSTG